MARETNRGIKDLDGTRHWIRREQDLLSAFRWKDLQSALRNFRRSGSPMPVDEQREEHPEYYLEVEAQQT